jgi:hypothetical protein
MISKEITPLAHFWFFWWELKWIQLLKIGAFTFSYKFS